MEGVRRPTAGGIEHRAGGAQAGNHTQGGRAPPGGAEAVSPCQPAAPLGDMPENGPCGQRQVGPLCAAFVTDGDQGDPHVPPHSTDGCSRFWAVPGEGTSQCPVAAGALSGVDRGCQPETKLTPTRGAWLGAGGLLTGSGQ